MRAVFALLILGILLTSAAAAIFFMLYMLGYIGH
jgi:hypothetical protein